MSNEATVFIIDDDQAVRDSLRWLIESLQHSVETYDSAQAFLDAYNPEKTGCLVLDVRLPGMSGLQLQQKLTQDNIKIPIIIITGHGDVPMAVRCLQNGARHFLEKPFRDQEILDCVQECIDFSTIQAESKEKRDSILNQITTLTPRETEIMKDIVKGLTNKKIAIKLEISSKTVEVHRIRIMKKMQASSLAELVKMNMLLNQSSLP